MQPLAPGIAPKAQQGGDRQCPHPWGM
jgi:hypothetical protein